MELTWVPSEARGESPKLSGSLTVEAPNFKVRAEFKARFAQLPLEDVDGLSRDEVLRRRSEQILGMADLWEKARQHVKAVDLTLVSTGEKATSVDELDVAPWGESVIAELVVAFVVGLSKN